MQRAFPAGLLTGGLVELELHDEAEEIAQVRRVAGDVVFRAGIERILRTRARRDDALVLQAQIGPGLVVLFRRCLARQDAPAPAVDRNRKWQEGNLVQRGLKEQGGVGVRPRLLFSADKADLLEVFRRDRQGDEVPDRLMEAIMGAVLVEMVLMAIGELVVIVPELMVDGVEILRIDLRTHLDAHILVIIEVPGRGMADHLAPLRLGDHRAFPEGLRQRVEAERGKEGFPRLNHLQRCIALCRQPLGHIIAWSRRIGLEDVIDARPLLRPHIAQQVGADRPGRRLHSIAVECVQPPARIAVQLLVERLDLAPQALDFGLHLGRLHVVIRQPHLVEARIAQLARALIGDVDHPRIVRRHRHGNRVPALPHRLQLFGIAGLLDDPRGFQQVHLPALIGKLAGRVGGVEARGDVGKLFRRALARRGGNRDAAAQDLDFPRDIRRQFAHVKPFRLIGERDKQLGVFRALFGGGRTGFGRDIGRLLPIGLGRLMAARGDLRLGIAQEGPRLDGALFHFDGGGVDLGGARTAGRKRQGERREACRGQNWFQELTGHGTKPSQAVSCQQSANCPLRQSAAENAFRARVSSGRGHGARRPSHPLVHHKPSDAGARAARRQTLR